jgi:predicted O-methyltransferase YrrM
VSKNIFRYEDKLRKEYPEFKLIMSEAEDAIVEKEIIAAMNSKNILELGTATGAWAAWIHNNIKGLKFYLTENFYELSKYTLYEKFPKNIAELSKNLSAFTNETINFEAFADDYDDIKHKIKDPVDYARVDCNTKNMKQVFEYLLETGSHELIIVLDDCTPNSAICRLLVLSEFIHTNQLKVFWAGKERMAFCRYDYDSKPVIDYLTYKNKTIKRYFETVYPWDDFVIADTPQYYLVTKAKQ